MYKVSDLQIVSFPTKPGRYLIIDIDGVVVSDAAGYGFKTVQSAQKGVWWECEGKHLQSEKPKKDYKKRPVKIDTNLPGSPF